jgi:hypothetical protein
MARESLHPLAPNRENPDGQRVEIATTNEKRGRSSPVPEILHVSEEMGTRAGVFEGPDFSNPPPRLTSYGERNGNRIEGHNARRPPVNISQRAGCAITLGLHRVTLHRGLKKQT